MPFYHFISWLIARFINLILCPKKNHLINRPAKPHYISFCYCFFIPDLTRSLEQYSGSTDRQSATGKRLKASVTKHENTLACVLCSSDGGKCLKMITGWLRTSNSCQTKLRCCTLMTKHGRTEESMCPKGDWFVEENLFVA